MGLRKRHLLAFVALLVGTLVPSPAAANGVPTLVASGFDAPRGVAFYNGRLMVAESGRGGPNCSVSPAPSPPNPGAFCFGRSGRISSVNTTTGTHSAFVNNLFSVQEWVGGPFPDSLGLGGLSPRDGKLMAIQGVFPQQFEGYVCATSACQEDLAAAKQQAGALLQVSHNGHFHVVANVGRYDYDKSVTYANQEHDSNPYGVLGAETGTYVADAGTNTLDFVTSHGRITILVHFPNKYAAFPSDEVPTCVVKAADSLWVATLSGNLFKVHGGSVTQVANADLKHVTGCVSDGETTVYFINMWTNPGIPQPANGNIVKFNADEDTSSVIASGLDFPNMDTIGPDGNLYFSADSVCVTGFPLCPQGGTVWKLALSHEDDD